MLLATCELFATTSPVPSETYVKFAFSEIFGIGTWTNDPGVEAGLYETPEISEAIVFGGSIGSSRVPTAV
jgi:hypothetical protein